MRNTKGVRKGVRKRLLATTLALAMIGSLMIPTVAFGEDDPDESPGTQSEQLSTESIQPMGFSPLADFTDVSSPVAPVSLLATPVDLLDGTVANYLLLAVKDPSYASASYAINGGAVTPTSVLTDAGTVEYIKVPLPWGVMAGQLKVTLGGEDYTANFSAATGGIAAPSVIYGTTSMGFSEYYSDITGDVTAVEPAATTFAVGGTVLTPTDFITAGTRQQWAANDAQPKVDAISSATYGDAVHFIPTGNHLLNYDPVTTQGAGHEVLGIASVDVGISVDLLVNATLLNAAGLSTAQTTAVAAKVADVTAAPAGTIYKPKFLQVDGNWGARAATAVTESAAAAWPGGALNLATAYGGNFTNREVTFTFTNLPADLTANSAAGLWDTYLNNIYGGYVEGPNGHREPLVWLQNLFTHKAHTNFEVSINQDVFGRFGTLGLPGEVKIVVYAKGLQDIVVENVALATVADNSAAIEQGATHYVKQGDSSTYFEDGELHISGLSSETLANFNPATATITKGGVALDSSLYSLVNEGSEIAAVFSPAFFASPTLGGSYVISLIPNDASTWHKTFSFTVNLLVDRPTLAIDGAGAFAATDASPVSIEQGRALSFSNEAYAKAISIAARGGSTITDVTPIGATAAPAIGTVLKLSGAAGSAYTIDTASLTAGHVYRLNIITTGYATGAPSPSTTAQYFIAVSEVATVAIAGQATAVEGKTVEYTISSTNLTSIQTLALAIEHSDNLELVSATASDAALTAIIIPGVGSLPTTVCLLSTTGPVSLPDGDPVVTLLFTAKASGSASVSLVKAGAASSGADYFVKLPAGSDATVDTSIFGAYDFNRDGRTSLADLSYAQEFYRATGADLALAVSLGIDVNEDGTIDLADFILILPHVW